MKKMKAVIFAAALVIGFTSVGGAASAVGYCKEPCLETTGVGPKPSCLLVGPCLKEI